MVQRKIYHTQISEKEAKLDVKLGNSSWERYAHVRITDMITCIAYRCWMLQTLSMFPLTMSRTGVDACGLWWFEWECPTCRSRHLTPGSQWGVLWGRRIVLLEETYHWRRLFESVKTPCHFQFISSTSCFQFKTWALNRRTCYFSHLQFITMDTLHFGIITKDKPIF